MSKFEFPTRKEFRKRFGESIPEHTEPIIFHVENEEPFIFIVDRNYEPQRQLAYMCDRFMAALDGQVQSTLLAGDYLTRGAMERADRLALEFDRAAEEYLCGRSMVAKTIGLDGNARYWYIGYKYGPRKPYNDKKKNLGTDGDFLVRTIHFERDTAVTAILHYAPTYAAAANWIIRFLANRRPGQVRPVVQPTLISRHILRRVGQLVQARKSRWEKTWK